jgi:serine/threonine protein kinase
VHQEGDADQSLATQGMVQRAIDQYTTHVDQFMEQADRLDKIKDIMRTKRLVDGVCIGAINPKRKRLILPMDTNNFDASNLLVVKNLVGYVPLREIELYRTGTPNPLLEAKLNYKALIRMKKEIELIPEVLQKIGIYHNDLHPRNILVNPSTGEVKLIDWDRAEIRNSANSDSSIAESEAIRFASEIVDEYKYIVYNMTYKSVMALKQIPIAIPPTDIMSLPIKYLKKLQAQLANTDMIHPRNKKRIERMVSLYSAKATKIKRKVRKMKQRRAQLRLQLEERYREPEVQESSQQIQQSSEARTPTPTPASVPTPRTRPLATTGQVHRRPQPRKSPTKMQMAMKRNRMMMDRKALRIQNAKNPIGQQKSSLPPLIK